MDNELSAETRVAVESHLSRCASCKQELDSLSFSYQLTDRLRHLELSPKIWEGVKTGTGQDWYKLILRRLGWRPLTARPWRPILAGAGLLAILLALVILVPGPGPMEKEFTDYMQWREAVYDQNRELLFSTLPVTESELIPNPFVQPVSLTEENPFGE
jgi:hypothetical protein